MNLLVMAKELMLENSTSMLLCWALFHLYDCNDIFVWMKLLIFRFFPPNIFV